MEQQTGTNSDHLMGIRMFGERVRKAYVGAKKLYEHELNNALKLPQMTISSR